MEMLVNYNKLEFEVSNWVYDFFHQDNFEDTDSAIAELFSAYYNHKYLRYCIDKLINNLNLSADFLLIIKYIQKLLNIFVIMFVGN